MHRPRVVGVVAKAPARCTWHLVAQSVWFCSASNFTKRNPLLFLLPFFFLFVCRLGLYSHCHGNVFSPQVSLSVLSEPQVVLGGLGWERC